MPPTFRAYQPEQGLLLPEDMREWLPEGHLAPYVGDLVECMDLGAFYARYEGDGRRKSPYEPRMMVKVLIYGYATGVFSSRRLARRLEEVAALLERSVDAEEEARFGQEFRGDELPDELRVDRLAKIRAAKARLEARQRESDDARGRRREAQPQGPYKRGYGEAQDNFTDPESRIMKTSQDGFQQCYTAQLAVEGESQLVVAAEVSASDQGRMVPLLRAVESAHGTRRCWPTRGTATRLPSPRSGSSGWTATWPWAGRVAARSRRTPGSIRPRRRSWRRKRGSRSTRSASGAPRRRWIKEALGFRRFSVRGLTKARGEWDLVCLALNVKRMNGLQAA